MPWCGGDVSLDVVSQDRRFHVDKHLSGVVTLPVQHRC